MKKLFFFKSSAASGNGNSNPVPPLPSNNDKVCWEKPRKSSAESHITDSKAPERSQYPKDLFSRQGEQYKESPGSAGSGLRRSLSFSSIYSDLGEWNSNGLSEHSKSPSTTSNSQPQMADNRIRCRSVTPEKPKPKRSDRSAIQTRNAANKSPNSIRGYIDSSGNSPYSSPVRLRCRAARLPQVPNEFLDLYIDGEQHDRNLRPESDSERNSSDAGKENGLLIENRKMAFSKRPPRAHSKAPASPIKGNLGKLRSHSLRESRNHHVCISFGDWSRDDVLPSSPQQFSKNVVERVPHVPPQILTESHDYDSETTTTIEDIYEDYSEPHPNFDSKNIPQKRQLIENTVPISDAPYKATNGCYAKEIPGFLKQSSFLGDGFVTIKHEENVDADLRRKGREAEERVLLLEQELEQLSLRDCGFSIPTLLQTIEKITQDRRSLALEVSSQIQSRLSERVSANEALKRARLDLDVRTRRLEREKTELQSSLEKELDRRSSDWSFKLEKYQSEEQRLRDRVRELAEQNVSLQREVSCLNSREAGTTNRLSELEVQLKEVTERLEEARVENHNLQQALLELQQRSKGLEDDRDCIRKGYKQRENENREFQKVVARLQRICGDQEKTISGLRHALSNEIGKQSSEKGDDIYRLQVEQTRLAGIELMLRKEVDSYRVEVDSLRHENIDLLERLKVTQNGGVFSSLKLDQELGARVNCLQDQCLSLLDQNDQLCGKLLEFVKGSTCSFPDVSSLDEVKEVGQGFERYSVLECDMKFQSLRRAAQNLRRSLQTIHVVLQEKSELDASESLTHSLDNGKSGHPRGHSSEGDLELELKAEILLTRVLREKLCHKELELEQLQAELATSVRGHDIVRCENQRLQDAISSLTHKMKDLELQMLRKNESINQGQSDLQECMKELTITRGILPKVTQERDLMWEEVKQYSEKNMLLNREVISFKKRIEALEEDILLKEGQITILKDSIDTKPFDILCSPKSLKEFRLE